MVDWDYRAVGRPRPARQIQYGREHPRRRGSSRMASARIRGRSRAPGIMGPFGAAVMLGAWVRPSAPSRDDGYR